MTELTVFSRYSFGKRYTATEAAISHFVWIVSGEAHGEHNLLAGRQLLRAL
ncbi:MAG: hypothetical protein K0U93_28405 [Gammaproteobacteria bacterium]|nr:hypothetical protein [Gammaproteobacteria bacterium]